MRPFDPKRFDRPTGFERIQPSYANVANPYKRQLAASQRFFFSVETTFSKPKARKRSAHYSHPMLGVIPVYLTDLEIRLPDIMKISIGG